MSGWGRWPVILAALGAVLILSVTRLPPEGWRFSFVDVRYYGRVYEWRRRDAPATGLDAVYTAGLAASAFAAAWCLLRIVCRGVAIAVYRPPGFQRGRAARTMLGVSLFFAVAVIGAGVGWPYRLAQRWVASVDRPSPFIVSLGSAPSYPAARAVAPPGLTYDQETVVIRAAMRQGGARQRTAGLRILTGTRSASAAAGILEAAIVVEPDGAVRATEARVLALTGMPEGLAVLRRLTTDQDARVREAAVDGMGVFYGSEWLGGGIAPISSLRLATDPPIEVSGGWRLMAPPTVDPADLARITATMTAPPPPATLGEREAAARALIGSQPAGYSLRYSEWGVYVDGGAGTAAAMGSGDFPDFVYRIGGAAGDGKNAGTFRRTWSCIVQLSADRPMAVDMEVSIAGGWVRAVYPKFDDLVFQPMSGTTAGGGDAGAAVIDAFDPRGPAFLNGLRGGPPWLRPRDGIGPIARLTIQRTLGQLGQAWSGTTDGIGARWMSVIVSPERLAWMNPPAIEHGGRGSAAWERLRAIDGNSWLSSRGESERFVVYGGPTGRGAALEPKLGRDGRLRWSAGVGYRHYDWRAGSPGRVLYVSVTPAGVARQWLGNPYYDGEADVGSLTPGSGKGVEDEFRGALEALGLKPAEAGALMATWGDRFFRAPGRRLLTLMTTTDYDRACPMRARPWPTSRVRVGVALAEITD